MSSTTYSEFEDWLPRPAAVKLAVALWIAGFAVAAATAVRLHRAGPHSSPPFAATQVDVIPADGAASGGIIVIPEDVVVGRRTPSAGAAMKQKP